MTESALVAKIVTRLRRHKLFVVKLHGSPLQRAGLPDLLVIAPGGRAVWLEVKTETGVVSRLQEHTLGLLRAAGCVAEVVRSVEEAERALGITPCD